MTLSANPELIAKKMVSIDRPEDAVAAFYAWFHSKSRLYARQEGEETALFIDAKSRLGPVGILRATAPHLVAPLLSSLPAGGRYVMTTWSLATALGEAANITETQQNRIFTLEPERLRRFVQKDTHIHHSKEKVTAVVDGKNVSECILLWRSPHFAEIGIATEPPFRGRGLGHTLVAEMAAGLIEQGVAPLCVVSADNAGSIRVAEKAGFTPCGEDEFAGLMTL